MDMENHKKFRGKFLGKVDINNVDEFVRTHGITSGSFDDLYVGDYFISTFKIDRERTIVFRVAETDMYHNTTEQHSICVIPDTIIYMHSLHAYWGGCGYRMSYMNKVIMPEINKAMELVFGDHLLKYPELLTIDNFGSVTEDTVQCILMSELEVFGNREYSHPENEVLFGKQLSLFAQRPNFIMCDIWNWLRDTYGSTDSVACGPGKCGDRYHVFNNDIIGVRPRFLLG